MKKAFSALALSVVGLAFSSCCSLSGSCSKGKKVLLDDGTTRTCSKCTRYFDSNSGCCGTVGDTVFNRASSQGWDGSPQIGLIPTMKPLAE